MGAGYVHAQSPRYGQLFAILWTVAPQVLLSMEFSRQKYWNEQPFPSPEDCPDPGVKPTSPALADGFLTTKPPRKPRVLGDPPANQPTSDTSLLPHESRLMR